MVHIFILHGNFSSAEKMEPLEENLKAYCASREPFEKAEEADTSAPMRLNFHRLNYDYKPSLIDCAIDVYSRTTKDLTAVNQDPGGSDNEGGGDQIILIGHSQGGLVCRLVALMMSGCDLKPEFAESTDDRQGLREDVWNDWRRLLTYTHKLAIPSGEVGPVKRYTVLGVAALASPHSGAFTMGQFSTLAGVLALGLEAFGADVLGAKNLKDLTSDRLPRLMQYMTVPKARYLSISGSSVNRYTLGCDTLLSEVASAVIPNFSVQLSKPNDRIVEEDSADLTNNMLPLEVETKPEHFSCYVNATQATHFDVYKRNEVAKRLAEWISTISTEGRSG